MFIYFYIISMFIYFYIISMFIYFYIISIMFIYWYIISIIVQEMADDISRFFGMFGLAWKNSHPMSEGLVSLGILGDQLRASLNPSIR